MRNPGASTVIEDQADTLAHDFDHVVTDAQELLATMGTEGGTKIAEMKKRVQASIDVARGHLGELHANITEGAKAAVKSTDRYVRDNPWGAVGMGAVLGLLVGYVVARRNA